jgi:hypothetical protein
MQVLSFSFLDGVTDAVIWAVSEASEPGGTADCITMSVGGVRQVHSYGGCHQAAEKTKQSSAFRFLSWSFWQALDRPLLPSKSTLVGLSSIFEQRKSKLMASAHYMNDHLCMPNER